MQIEMVDPDKAKFSTEYLEIRDAILAANRDGKALVIRDIADVEVRQIVRSVGREMKIKGIKTVKGDDELIVLLPVPTRMTMSQTFQLKEGKVSETTREYEDRLKSENAERIRLKSENAELIHKNSQTRLEDRLKSENAERIQHQPKDVTSTTLTDEVEPTLPIPRTTLKGKQRSRDRVGA
jgi:hypothetical protein